MERHIVLAAAIALLGLWSMRAALGGGLLTLPKDFPKIELTFGVGDQELKWTCDPTKENQSSANLAGYSLGLRVEENGIQKILRFKLEPPTGAKLSVNSYTARVILPTEGLHSVMVPNTRILAHTLIYYHEHRKWPENVPLYRCLVPEEFGEAAQANSEAPYIQLTDNKGNNKFAVGWAVADTNTNLNGNGEGKNYILTLARKNDIPFTGEELEDALIISSASEPWMDVENAYARAFDKYNGRPKRPAAPAWTSEPVFCTWYCYGDHIDQTGVLKIANKCRDLGFGTILIDAGWDTAPDGGWGDFENGNLGDFDADKVRFPDLPGAVKQMHDMGLRVELWYAPFWQGKKSHAYQEKTKSWHAQTQEGESRDLCPKYPGTRELLKEQYAGVARKYDIDGMWFDGADGVPPVCTADHKHLDQPMGEAFVDCLAAARDGLRSVKPDAITEVRVLHGNLNSKRAIDIVQPSDAPESFEMLRLAGIHLRPWAYDIVLKNDPMMWKKDADAATVGKFLATMVCNGVPALSVDYLTASDEQCRLTKAWLAFYKEHKQTLLKGEFKLFGADYTHPDMMLVGAREAVVYVQNPKTNEVVLPKSVEKVVLLNCTNSDKLSLKINMEKGKRSVQAYAPDWSLKDAKVSVANIGAATELSVPQGGAAVIE